MIERACDCCDQPIPDGQEMASQLFEGATICRACGEKEPYAQAIVNYLETDSGDSTQGF